MMTDPSSLIAAPRVGDVVLRPFRGAADFSSMASVANASFAADGVLALRTAEGLAQDYAAFTACDPLQDCIVAERDGEMMGYGRCWWFTQADGLVLHAHVGFVPGRWRGQGIGRMLQQWLEQRHRVVAARQPRSPHVHHAYVQQGELARVQFLHARGYTPIRHFFEMLHTRLQDALEFPLPEGLELRPVLPEHYRAIWDAHHVAFTDHWGMGPPAPGEYEQWLQSPAFQPERWQVAWDGNRVAGQVRTYILVDENRSLSRRRGYTEFISVGRPWRRRGLARALIARSLRLLGDAGMDESALKVDGENLSGANRVYADCGFEVVKRDTVYRKVLAL